MSEEWIEKWTEEEIKEELSAIIWEYQSCHEDRSKEDLMKLLFGELFTELRYVLDDYPSVVNEQD